MPLRKCYLLPPISSFFTVISSLLFVTAFGYGSPGPIAAAFGENGFFCVPLMLVGNNRSFVGIKTTRHLWFPLSIWFLPWLLSLVVKDFSAVLLRTIRRHLVGIYWI
ncbi:hypothetical protein Goklo_025511, partial [Gossypium klotzschianum]|nr:hypothetical protein [Gossypium klotzschianum]